MSEKAQAYCVKCKTKREIANPKPVYTEKGTPATRGECSVCGTTLFRMGATEAHSHIAKPEKTRISNKKRKAAPSVKKAHKLVIVESPAKARSVGHFLGKGYTVKASKGHVRDLLKSQLSVDVEKNFEPKYRILDDKRDVVKELKTVVKTADEIYLATDPDREGEAIAWHLIAATDADETRVKRVVFHEITEAAVQNAFSHPRPLNMDLVNAQQARRILDRLVGYNISELLWEKVRNYLSAGRVQSIALRMVVDREREIEAFKPEEYWTLDAKLRKHIQNGSNKTKPFIARLVKINGKDANFRVEGDVTPHLGILERSRYTVTDIKHGFRQRKPAPPFTTSTLQQEASRRLGYTAGRTMTIAQQLYEGVDVGGKDGAVGLITYMRTDSTNVSEQAQTEARTFIRERYGKDYLPHKAPQYKTRTKGAQEAHEAIRPTGILREPNSLEGKLTRDQLKLYTLIWQRFVASQMANAVYNIIRVDISAGMEQDNTPYEFRVSGSVIKFNGFLAVYEESRDEDALIDEDEGRILPEMNVGEILDLLQLLPEQHFTQPPPRFTEATLVGTLENNGIGRPSTYAPIVAVIQNREYVTKEDKRLIPTETGKIVNDLLVQFFPDIMDYQFTARMENQLDDISEGQRQWRPVLQDFYHPFKHQLHNASEHMPKVRQEEFVGRDCPVCSNPLVIRYGRFGKFIGCSDYPNCRHTEPLLERMGISCPLCGKEHGGEIVVRKSRKGRTFYGCTRFPDCDYTSWKRPLAQPCPNCNSLLIEQSRTTAQCSECGNTYRMDELAEFEAEPA